MRTSPVTRVSTEVQFHQMLDIFEEAFEDTENYGKATRPKAPYIQALLTNPDFIGLLSVDGQGNAAGALAAYVLRKFEQERSEIYIYDLGVRTRARKQGVAGSLIEELKELARQMGASSIFVQADKGAEDYPAQQLYRKLGSEADVFHYDLKLD